MKKALYGMILCLALCGLVLSGCEELLNAATGTKVTGVSLDQNNLTVAVDQSKVLIPTITPPDATNKKVTWQSVDPATATVVEGVVTGKKTGNTTIIVKTGDGGYTDTCAVTVTAAGDSGKEGGNEADGTDPEKPGTDPVQTRNSPAQTQRSPAQTQRTPVQSPAQTQRNPAQTRRSPMNQKSRMNRNHP